MVEVFAGAEPWATEGDDIGVLILHGFTGNPVSVRPVADALAARGRTVEVPRLPGHGTTWQDCQRTTWRDWAREASGALDALAARTRTRVVVGLSMGGTLALHLAQTRAEDLAGVVVINASVRSWDPRLKALGAIKHVVGSLPGIGNDIAKPGGDELPYDRVPLRALASFIELQRMVRSGLPSVALPLLQLTSRQDHVVEPANAELITQGVSSDDVTQVWLERSYHVATLDHDADVIIDRTAAFVDRVAT